MSVVSHATQLDLMREEGIKPDWVDEYLYTNAVDPRQPSREELAAALDRIPRGDEDCVLKCALHLSPTDYEGLEAKAKRVVSCKPIAGAMKIRRRR
jgi:hypothetical protein